jgi:integrase
MARQKSASLQARHQRGCNSGKGWTAAEPRAAGCDCVPALHVVYRDRAGKQVREAAGHDLLEGQATLIQKRKEIRDHDGADKPAVILFGAWCDEWLSTRRRARPSSLTEYRTSIRFAKAAIGAEKPVRGVSTADVFRFADYVKKPPRPKDDPRKPRETSSTTQRKHLNTLERILNGAVRRGYLDRNPFDRIEDDELPSIAKTEAPFFTNDELTLLATEIPKGLYRTIFLVAAKTGMRQGELLALKWRDVDLANAVIRVRQSYTSKSDLDGNRIGVSEPKSRSSSRDVQLTADVVDALGKWWGQCHRPGDARLLFPGGARDGYITAGALTRNVLYSAMKRAGIPRDGGNGERKWHSLRHTYAKIAIENGVNMVALSKQLGHSSVSVTANVYANHLEEAEKRSQTDKLEGAFAF